MAFGAVAIASIVIPAFGNAAPESVRLHIESGVGTFTYGSTVQTITTARNGCQITSAETIIDLGAGRRQQRSARVCVRLDRRQGLRFERQRNTVQSGRPGRDPHARSGRRRSDRRAQLREDPARPRDDRQRRRAPHPLGWRKHSALPAADRYQHRSGPDTRTRLRHGGSVHRRVGSRRRGRRLRRTEQLRTQQRRQRQLHLDRRSRVRLRLHRAHHLDRHRLSRGGLGPWQPPGVRHDPVPRQQRTGRQRRLVHHSRGHRAHGQRARQRHRRRRR
jgi:hypothetical protein